MVEEMKDEGVGDPTKIFLEEALEKQRSPMIVNFADIIQKLRANDKFSSNNHS